jgi:hypothetical protein
VTAAAAAAAGGDVGVGPAALACKLTAWAYVLTKSKREKRAKVSVKTIQEFEDEPLLKSLI